MADPSHLGNQTIPGVEDEDVDASQLIRIVIGATLFFTILVVAAFSVTNLRFVNARIAAAEQTGYPLLRETRMEGQAKLDRYEVVDPEANIYRIPIDRAMERIVEESQ